MREREIPGFFDGSEIHDADLKIIGPSPGDLEFANQVHKELVRERRRASYRRVDSPGNPQEIAPWPLVGKLPKPWRDLVIVGTAVLAGVAAAACSGGGPKPKPEQPSDAGDTGANRPKVEARKDKPEPEPLNPNGFLDWPFGKHPDMKHVQGWIYSGKEVPDGKEHGANDYVLGTDPNLASTWKKFPVLAAADGEPCQESFDTNLGRNHAVRVRHPNGYETRNLHMDPQSISEAQIPTCTSDKTKGKAVKRGDKLGLTSDTGTEPGRWHNHFEVFDPSGKLVDPYDIYGKKDKYPDPNLTNGIPCGPKALWINCPTGEVLGARTTAPTPTATARPTSTPEPARTLSPQPTPTTPGVRPPIRPEVPRQEIEGRERELIMDFLNKALKPPFKPMDRLDFRKEFAAPILEDQEVIKGDWHIKAPRFDALGAVLTNRYDMKVEYFKTVKGRRYQEGGLPIDVNIHVEFSTRLSETVTMANLVAKIGHYFNLPQNLSLNAWQEIDPVSAGSSWKILESFWQNPDGTVETRSILIDYNSNTNNAKVDLVACKFFPTIPRIRPVESCYVSLPGLRLPRYRPPREVKIPSTSLQSPDKRSLEQYSPSVLKEAKDGIIDLGDWQLVVAAWTETSPTDRPNFKHVWVNLLIKNKSGQLLSLENLKRDYIFVIEVKDHTYPSFILSNQILEEPRLSPGEQIIKELYFLPIPEDAKNYFLEIRRADTNEPIYKVQYGTFGRIR